MGGQKNVSTSPVVCTQVFLAHYADGRHAVEAEKTVWIKNNMIKTCGAQGWIDKVLKT